MEVKEISGVSSCPFCGAKQGLFFSLVLTLFFWYAGWYVACWKCGAQGPTRLTRERAKRSWNTRARGEAPGGCNE